MMLWDQLSPKPKYPLRHSWLLRSLLVNASLFPLGDTAEGSYLKGICSVPGCRRRLGPENWNETHEKSGHTRLGMDPQTLTWNLDPLGGKAMTFHHQQST